MNPRLRAIMLLLFADPVLRTTGVAAQTQMLAAMQDTTWTRHDGAPLGIGTMAIGPDHLLYVATFSSIFRFDGAVFEPVLVPGVEVTSSVRGLFSYRAIFAYAI